MAEGIIEGLFKLLLVWIAIVAVGAFVAASVKKLSHRVVVMLLALVSVPAYFAFEVSPVGEAFHKARETRVYDKEKQAFHAYCVGRKSSISQVASPVDSAVAISFLGTNTYELASFNAGELADSFTARPPFAGQLCNNSSLKYLEGRSVNRGPKQFRFQLCPTLRADEIDNPIAGYKLVFSAPFDPAPNPVFPYRKFTKIQVQLMESGTQKIIGEDTLFFLGPTADGNEVCPNAYEQVHELLLKAFATQSANPSFHRTLRDEAAQRR